MLGEIEEHGQRLLVSDLIGDVDGCIRQIGGDSALADSFGDRTTLGFQLAVV